MLEYELFGKLLQYTSVAHKHKRIIDSSTSHAIYFRLTAIRTLFSSWSTKDSF